MKNIKKDIPAIAGLLLTTSLAVVSGGLVNPATSSILSGIGTAGSSIGAGLAANFIGKFSPEKMKRWLKDVHPGDLNHHIKKLFVKSVNEALYYIQVMFFDTDFSDTEKKEAKKLIKTLQKRLPNLLLKGNQIKLEELEVKHFLYEKEKEDDICNFIKQEFDTFGITEPFKSFLAQNLPAQIQLCFGEGLKAPSNRNAWIAFQRMLIEDIRTDIKNLKIEKSNFSEEQIAEIHKLTELLNNKKLVEVKIKNGIEESLKSIENKTNEIKILLEKINRQNRINHIIVYTLIVCLLAAGGFVAHKTVNQPFTATIQVVDWNNKTDNPEIYSNGGIISFDGKKEYDNELTTTNKGKFNLNLPASYKKQSVRVYFQPEEGYKYMKLDTTIVVYKNSTYYLKMYFEGIDKITCTVINAFPHEPFRDATVEINEEKCITDSTGTFTIILPVEKQKRVQKLTIKKDGYENFVINEFDMTINNTHILWDFSKK